MTKAILLTENQKVKNWLCQWQKLNPYKKTKRIELNTKFKKQFNTITF